MEDGTGARTWAGRGRAYGRDEEWGGILLIGGKFGRGHIILGAYNIILSYMDFRNETKVKLLPFTEHVT